MKAEHDAADAADGKSKKRDKDILRLEDKINALCAAVAEIQPSVTRAAKNGRSRAKAAVEH